MINGLVPRYLSDFLPPYVHDVSRYGLRDSNNLYKPKIRKGYALKSFLWTTTFKQFKREMRKRLFYKSNDLLNFGTGKGAINQSRIRMGLSALNAHRKKYNFILFNDCPLCGNKPENENHYFFKCVELTVPRTANGNLNPLDIVFTVYCTPTTN